MFLHLKTFDKQISLHSKEAVPELEANEDAGIVGIPAKPAEPLGNVVREAMDYWKKTETNLVAYIEDEENKRLLDFNKTAEENGLQSDDFITVTTQEQFENGI